MNTLKVTKKSISQLNSQNLQFNSIPQRLKKVQYPLFINELYPYFISPYFIYVIGLYNIFIMRVHRRRKWDINHSLTPQPQYSFDTSYKINIPEIPEIKKADPYSKTPFNSTHNRSRKHRLAEQRNTEIQKTNRMLYEKIRKIMQKGHSSQKKIEPQQQDSPNMNNQFLNTSIKPMSLPQVRSNIFSLRQTQTQLNSILDNRPKFAQKYFQQLAEARKKLQNIHAQQIGNFVCYGWKVTVLNMNHNEFIVLNGRKGKKQVKKKYIYDKIKSKIENNLQQWVSSKFQIQI